MSNYAKSIIKQSQQTVSKAKSKCAVKINSRKNKKMSFIRFIKYPMRTRAGVFKLSCQSPRKTTLCQRPMAKLRSDNYDTRTITSHTWLKSHKTILIISFITKMVLRMLRVPTSIKNMFSDKGGGHQLRKRKRKRSVE